MSRPPFLTIYTPTHRRPEGLRRCMASVEAQTAIARIEHLIVPDYVGHGIEGMFERVSRYRDAVHGQYVTILGDDDVLAAADVVEQLEGFAVDALYPPVLIVSVTKARATWPQGVPWPPVYAQIDLGCVITRSDVWYQHAADYGKHYAGDYDYMRSVAKAGHPATLCPLLFARGPVGLGLPEQADSAIYAREEHELYGVQP